MLIMCALKMLSCVCGLAGLRATIYEWVKEVRMWKDIPVEYYVFNVEMELLYQWNFSISVIGHRLWR